MADLKLFRFSSGGVEELVGNCATLEKSLQTQFENNLEALLGVRFLASEFRTGEGGRMDSLGIDENNCPVVIEYKRSSNENVITQGLYYLDWLMGHRKDFEWLVMERFGKDMAHSVDWSGVRLICVAGDFQKWDQHAVKQMNRTIDLVRYQRYGDDLLMLEQITSTTARKPAQASQALPVDMSEPPVLSKAGKKYKTITQQMAESNQHVSDLYAAVASYLEASGDDVQVRVTDFYVAFRRLKNFACVEVRNQLGRVVVYLKLNPDDFVLEPGFTRDVRNVGHFGTGDLELTLNSIDDVDRAKPLFDLAYHSG